LLKYCIMNICRVKDSVKFQRVTWKDTHYSIDFLQSKDSCTFHKKSYLKIRLELVMFGQIIRSKPLENIKNLQWAKYFCICTLLNSLISKMHLNAWNFTRVVNCTQVTSPFLSGDLWLKQVGCIDEENWDF